MKFERRPAPSLKWVLTFSLMTFLVNWLSFPIMKSETSLDGFLMGCSVGYVVLLAGNFAILFGENKTYVR